MSYSSYVQVTALQLSEEKAKQLQLSLKTECKAKVSYSFTYQLLLHTCGQYQAFTSQHYTYLKQNWLHLHCRVDYRRVCEHFHLLLSLCFPSQSQLQALLSEEQAARSESESTAAHHQQQLASCTRELSCLQTSLTEEMTLTRQLKEDIDALEVGHSGFTIYG